MDTDIEAITFVPVNTKTGKPCRLAMQDLRLSGRVLPVGARLIVKHVFRSAEKEPLEVIYTFVLPRDAALRRFRVVREGFNVRSELRPTKQAVEEYEKAIEKGHLATIARAYRDGVVNLTVGNLRPGETVAVYLEIIAGVENRDDGFRFRFPFTIAPTYHKATKYVVTDTGDGETELSEDVFGDVVMPIWKKQADGLHSVGFDLLLEAPDGLSEVSSPSHPIRVNPREGLGARVSLSTANDLPNRDLVLDLRMRNEKPLVFAAMDEHGKGRVAVVIPSTQFGRRPEGGQRVVFVVDRSGSMDGQPMQQALKSVEACLGALSPEDRFGIVTFDNAVETFQSKMLDASSETRSSAKDFLAHIDARGGTELLRGLEAAFAMLHGEQGDVLLLTDGQVGESEPLIQAAKAHGVRVHCLGIGSASQDRFLSLLARETGGVERFVGPNERVDLAAVTLFSAIGRPVAENVSATITGLVNPAISPAPVAAVFAGTPFVLYANSGQAGSGELIVAYGPADASRDVRVPLSVADDKRLGEAIRLIQGARLTTDLEAQCEVADATRSVSDRRQSRITKALENLGNEYGLANRCMSLVAVVERAGDREGEIPKTEVVPVGMPSSTAFSAYFGQRDIAHGLLPAMSAFMVCDSAPVPPMAHDSPAFAYSARRAHSGAEDMLLELASRIEPDGGLPGKTPRSRILATLLALLHFVVNGHTEQGGAFAPHVRRMMAFMQSAKLSSFRVLQRHLIQTAMAQVQSGNVRVSGLERCVSDYLYRGTFSAAAFWREIHRLFVPNWQPK